MMLAAASDTIGLGASLAQEGCEQCTTSLVLRRLARAPSFQLMQVPDDDAHMHLQRLQQVVLHVALNSFRAFARARAMLPCCSRVRSSPPASGQREARDLSGLSSAPLR